eukprot:747950-Hanusia_phi.AAC.4
MENYEVDRHVESHSSRITSVDSRQSDGEEKLKKKPPPLPARPPPDSPPDLKSARRSQRGSTRKEAKGTFSEKNGNKSSSMQDVRGCVLLLFGLLQLFPDNCSPRAWVLHVRCKSLWLLSDMLLLRSLSSPCSFAQAGPTLGATRSKK